VADPAERDDRPGRRPRAKREQRWVPSRYVRAGGKFGYEGARWKTLPAESSDGTSKGLDQVDPEVTQVDWDRLRASVLMHRLALGVRRSVGQKQEARNRDDPGYGLRDWLVDELPFEPDETDVDAWQTMLRGGSPMQQTHVALLLALLDPSLLPGDLGLELGRFLGGARPVVRAVGLGAGSAAARRRGRS